jgi:hypothetical protein
MQRDISDPSSSESTMSDTTLSNIMSDLSVSETPRDESWINPLLRKPKPVSQRVSELRIVPTLPEPTKRRRLTFDPSDKRVAFVEEVDVYTPIYPPPYEDDVPTSVPDYGSDPGTGGRKSRLRPVFSTPPPSKKCTRKPSRGGIIKTKRKKQKKSVYDKLALRNYFDKETVISFYIPGVDDRWLC